MILKEVQKMTDIVKPKSKVDIDKLYSAASHGLTTKEIAGLLGVSYDTLTHSEVYMAQINKGRSELVQELKSLCIGRAKEGDNKLLVYILDKINSEEGSMPSSLAALLKK